VAVIVEPLDCRLLEGAVHPLDLAVRSGMVRFRQPVLNTVGLDVEFGQRNRIVFMLSFPYWFHLVRTQEWYFLSFNSILINAVVGVGLIFLGTSDVASEESGGRVWDNKPSRLVYGNYCGFGTRHGSLAPKPINKLDAACQAHDACYIAGLNHCLCDAKLATAARHIRSLPDTARGERIAARTIEDLFSTKFCKLFPRGVFPRRDPEILKSWFPPAPPRNPDRLEKE
jgi:hypothetical protein